MGGKALAAIEEERESIECSVGIGWAQLGLQGLPGTHGLVPGTLPHVGTYASLWTFLHWWHPAAVPILEQLCLLAFGLSSTRLCLLTLAVKRGCKESVRRMHHGGLHPQSKTPSLCQREILQIPQTLTKLPRYAHARPTGDVCAKDAVYQSLGWLCRQPTSISVCSIPNKTQK